MIAPEVKSSVAIVVGKIREAGRGWIPRLADLVGAFSRFAMNGERLTGNKTISKTFDLKADS